MSAFEDWFYENSWFSNYTDKEKIDFKQCWNAAIEHAEALKPSHNTQSDAIIANIKEYLIERAQQHDAWWLDDWVERGIDDYVNSRNNSTHL